MSQLRYKNVLDLDDRFWENADKFSKILIFIHWSDGMDDPNTEPYNVSDVYKVLLTNVTIIEDFPCLVDLQQYYDCVIEYEGLNFANISYGNSNWAEASAPGIAFEPEVYDVVDPLLTEIREKLDGKVIHLSSTNEEMIMQLALLREKHGLPGMSSKTGELFVSKIAFGNKIKEIGFMAPHGVFVDFSEHYTDINSILNIADFPDFPIVCKPIASSASKGLAKVYNKNGMAKFLEELNGHKFRKFVVQENLETWTMFAVFLMVTPHEGVLTTGIYEMIHQYCDFHVKKQTAGFIFLNEEDLIYKKLSPIVTEMFDKLDENKTCCAHFVELFVNPTDLANPAKITRNSVRFVEMAARPFAGGYLNWLISQRCGISQEPLHLLGPFMPKGITINRNPEFNHVAFISCPTLKGIVKDITDIQLILKEMGAKVLKHDCNIEVGDATKDATAIDMIAVGVAFAANSDKEVRNIYAYIKDLDYFTLE